jgi:mono/diheme cytochrome c family protein
MIPLLFLPSRKICAPLTSRRSNRSRQWPSFFPFTAPAASNACAGARSGAAPGTAARWRWLAPKEGSSINARVYSFKLGGQAPKPVIEFKRIPTPRPPLLATTPAEYQLGANLYDNFCLTCHGIAAITGGVLPDLRKSGRLQDAALWKDAVVDAALASRGMPRFAGHVSPEDAERIRAYVTRQAAMLFEAEQAAGRIAPAVRRTGRNWDSGSGVG